MPLAFVGGQSAVVRHCLKPLVSLLAVAGVSGDAEISSDDIMYIV